MTCSCGRCRSAATRHAADLLDVTNPAALDRFVATLVDDAARRARVRLTPDRANAATDVLTELAASTLPTLHGSTGVRHGSPVAMAGRLYGLELEGLSAEDRDFEIARQFVRFAEEVARDAGTAHDGVPPIEAVDAAVARAATSLAPGLPRSRRAKPAVRGSGRWFRDGTSIVVVGIDHGRRTYDQFTTNTQEVPHV